MVGEADVLRLDRMEAELAILRQEFSAFRADVDRFLKRYVGSCPACRGEFDLLVNHYSIGLFDNLVYVKCPHCNKSMPVVDNKTGGIEIVA
jgi:ssDNA-binding Zn-finger/Zn-ribbon topoisomerase 1